MEGKKKIKLVDTKRLGREGQKILDELMPKLEDEHFGEFIAIDVDTRDYFLDKNSIKATLKAKEKYPNNVFYKGRIGYRAAYSFKGR